MPNGRAPRHQPGRNGEASGASRSGGLGLRPRHRSRYLWPLVTLPAVVAGGFFLARSPGHPQSSAAITAAPGAVTAPKTAAACGAAAGAGGAPCAVGSVSVATAPASTARPAPARARGAAGRSGAAPSAGPPAAGTASAPVASHPASPAVRAGTPADQVLALINQARAQAGLPALVFSAALGRSAAAHNQAMAGGCGLSHQCAGEPGLGARESAAGAGWTAAGENIGEGGPEPGTTTAITQTAAALTQDMLNEKPPDDGHRRNILSSSFGRIGIAVFRDSAGTVWMTQDFSN